MPMPSAPAARPRSRRAIIASISGAGRLSKRPVRTRIGRGLARRVDLLPRSLLVHHRNARVDVSDRRAVVEQRAALARRIPVVDRHGAALELERRRHAVPRLVAIALHRLPVRVRIDEARRDDEAADVEVRRGR